MNELTASVKTLRPTTLDILKLSCVGVFLLCMSLLLLIIFPLFIISMFFIVARVIITSFAYWRAKLSGKAVHFSEIEVINS